MKFFLFLCGDLQENVTFYGVVGVVIGRRLWTWMMGKVGCANFGRNFRTWLGQMSKSLPFKETSGSAI